MNLSPNPEVERLRAELRKLIAAEAPRIPFRNGDRVAHSAEELNQLKSWTRRLFELNFIGRNWPREYGGLDDDDSEFKAMVSGTIEEACAPQPLAFWELPARCLIHFGTEEQKRKYLPKIRSADLVWCQLFSEPGAGSDLAALTTRAAWDGAKYFVDGQKVWNTQAQWADCGFMLARTSNEGAKHSGLSLFLLDMRQSGVDVRPIREATGTWDFNEVFLNGAEISEGDRIGAEGDGWNIAMQCLAFERVVMGSYAARTRAVMDALLDRARSLDGLPDGARHRLAELHVACDISGLLSAVIAARETAGKRRIKDPPISKLFFSETYQDIARCAMDLLGIDAAYQGKGAQVLDDGRWPDMWLYAPAFTISGGSSEIMLNVLAERALGMPRSA